MDVNDEDAFIACLDESCGEQYNRCIAPDGCIPACDNYDEVCGEDGPLRSYRSGARDIPLRPLAARLVLTLTQDTLHTPSFAGS